ncbi:hypothetical protein H2248_001705 [Termitomyces sp. 'cryptogamus']|nr:hypothetical protein H2248_001705 [Termitomyces sp. 'cryptogamus']
MDPFLPPSQSPRLTAPAPGPGSWVDMQGNAARTSFPCHDPPPHLFPSSSNTNSTLVSGAYNCFPKPTRRSCPHIPSSLSNNFSSAPLDTPTPTNINPILPHPNPLVAPFPIHPNIRPPSVPLHPDTVLIRPAYTFVLLQHDVFHTPHSLHAPLALVELPRSPFTPPMSPLHHNLSRPPSVPFAQPIPPVVHTPPFPYGHFPGPQLAAPPPCLPPSPLHAPAPPPQNFIFPNAPQFIPRSPLPEYQFQPLHFQPPPQHTVPDISSDSNKLPPLSSIPRLTGLSDWSSWYTHVMMLIEHLGLVGHICPIPPPGTPFDATCIIVVPPPYPPHNTLDEEHEYQTFWHKDGICSHILTGKLSTEILGSLPPVCSGPHNFPTRTARDILACLRRCYSVGSASSAKALKDSVTHLQCIPTTIPAYVQAWCTVVNQLDRTEWDFSPHDKIQGFMDGIPPLQAYALIREEVRRSWEVGPQGTFTFDVLADQILDIDIEVKRCNNQHRNNKSLNCNPVTHTSPNTSNPNTEMLNDQPAHRGSNNKHAKDSNFRPKANVAIQEPITEPIPAPPSFIPDDNRDVIPTIVEEDNDIIVSAYSSEPDKSPLPPYQAFLSSVDSALVADISLKFNSILDSGCTTHLIKDQKYIWSYDPSLASPVRTANCGILTTLAQGELLYGIIDLVILVKIQLAQF